MSAAVSRRLAPQADVLGRLDTIPGVGLTTAHGLVVERGTDMSRFPAAAHAASWAGRSPGQQESGARRTPVRPRKGNPGMPGRAPRRPARWAAAAAPRLVARTGDRPAAWAKAARAIAHTLLVRAACLPRDQTVYHEPTPAELPPHIQDRRKRRALRELTALGSTVTLAPATGT